jgi:hypothetical protein
MDDESVQYDSDIRSARSTNRDHRRRKEGFASNQRDPGYSEHCRRDRRPDDIKVTVALDEE